MTDTYTSGTEPVLEMARILHTEPVRTSLDRGWKGAVAQRWQHDAFRAALKPMTDHVFMTYFGTPRRIERRSDGHRVLSSTRPGSVTLIPAGEESEWDLNGSLDVLHLYVPPARLEALAEECHLSASHDLFDRTGFGDPVGSQLLTLIAEELEQPGVIDALYAEQLSTLVCTHLLRTHSACGGEPKNIWRGGLAPRQLDRVLAMMTERMGEDLPLDELATAAGLSPFYFIRAFKQATGTTPHRRLVELRAERAAVLLAGTKTPIAEVAVICGFASQSHMSTWFRRLKDTTPSRIRAGA